MNTINYGSSEYWDDLYKLETPDQEWYMRYHDLVEHIESYLDNRNKFLIVGPGDSRIVYMQI